MPTQEERLSVLEQPVTVLGKGIRDIHHHETILLGIVSEQGKDIREIKVSLAALNEHVDTFEQNVNNRFGALESHLGVLEQSVNNRFDKQDKKLDGVNSRLGALEGRFDEQGKKLDQVLLLLNTLTSKPE